MSSNKHRVYPDTLLLHALSIYPTPAFTVRETLICPYQLQIEKRGSFCRVLVLMKGRRDSELDCSITFSFYAFSRPRE